MRIFFIFMMGIFYFSYHAQTFSSTPNAIIPDDNTQISFDLSVGGLPTVIDQNFGLENVCLNIEHPYDADLEVKLEAPDGTHLLLFSGVGGGDDNFTNTCLDGVSNSISMGTAPFSGAYQSMSIMGNLNNGQNPNGTWKLLIVDMGAQDIGTLLSWSVTFSSNPALPFTFESSNIPIVKLTTLSNPINNDVKVPVLMQIIDNDSGLRNYTNQTDFAYEGQIMAEWQGFSGPSYPKKNFDFELIDDIGNKIDSSILGLPTENDWIFKAEYLDLSLMKNSISYDMARRMGNYAPRTTPCEIFLDGEYIGFYTLTEKIKRDINRVNISKLDSTDSSGNNLTGGYIIEMNINGDPADWTSAYQPSNSATACCAVEYKHVYPKSSDILPVQHDYIKNYVDSFEFVLANANYTDPINGYQKYADIHSFIDFLIVNEFSVNYDSYGRSTYLFKDKGGKLNYGPSWDYDRAMPYDNPSSSVGWVWEITHPNWPFPFHWQRLWEDSSYRKKLACRWQMLRQTTLSDNSFILQIDSLNTLFHEAALRNFTVWSSLGVSTYDIQVDSLKSFIIRRLNWIDDALALENVTIPTFYIPSDTTFCISSTYDAAFNGNQYTYFWNNDTANSVISFHQNGLHSLKVIDDYGCYATKTMNVIVDEPNANFTITRDNNLTFNFIPSSSNALSYLWDFGDGFSSISGQAQHTYANDGTYSVTLTISDSLTCNKTVIDTLQTLMLTLADELLPIPKIYPNPFSENVTINFSEILDSHLNLQLLNNLGQIMYEQSFSNELQTVDISTKDLTKGIYFMKIEQDSKKWMVKLMKD